MMLNAVPALDLGHAHHHLVERVGVAAGDGLERGDHVGQAHHRVDAEVRHRGVRALAA